MGGHWGQSSHSVEVLKINILALIERDPQEDSTTIYREHIEYQSIDTLRTMTSFGINVKIHDPLAPVTKIFTMMTGSWYIIYSSQGPPAEHTVTYMPATAFYLIPNAVRGRYCTIRYSWNIMPVWNYFLFLEDLPYKDVTVQLLCVRPLLDMCMMS